MELAPTEFADVLPDDPDRQSILCCVKAGAMIGWEDRFHTDRVVNRYQWAVAVSRVMDHLGLVVDGVSVLPPDVPAGHWAAAAIVRSASVLQVDAGQSFRGGRLVTPAEVAFQAGRLLARARPGAPPCSADPQGRIVTRRHLARVVACVLERCGLRCVFRRAASSPPVALREAKSSGASPIASPHVAAPPEIKRPARVPTLSGFPEPFASGYGLARSTLSPDGRFGFLLAEASDLETGLASAVLVQTQPRRIVEALPCRPSYYNPFTHETFTARWAPDSSAVVYKAESKWAPVAVALLQLVDGRVVGRTDLLKRSHGLFLADFGDCGPARFNEHFDFLIDLTCKFSDSRHLSVHGSAFTNPKQIPTQRSWEAEMDAVWSVEHERWQNLRVVRRMCGYYPPSSR